MREDIRTDFTPSGPLPPRLEEVVHSDSVERPARREPLSFIECSEITDIERFVALRDQLPERHQLMLTKYTSAQYLEQRARLFLAEGEGGGYGLLPDGEIISVFSLPGHRIGRALIEDALLRGGTRVECFDIDNKLPKLYRQFGFVETERISWNSGQAPRGWRFDKYGTPDVVIMDLLSH